MAKRIAWILTDWNSNPYRAENDLYGGIGYYRVIKPSQVLRKWYDIEVIGADFRHWGTEDESYTRIGRDYDLIISKHISNGKAASNLLAVGQHFGKKVLVDIDDDYLNIRQDNPAFKDYEILKGGRYFLGAMLSLSNGLMVSTQPLKALYSKFNAEIDILPNCNDVKDWPKPKVHDDGIIRIGYAGGNAHNDDIALIIEPMAKILEKYPNVLFEICGALTNDQAKELGSKMLKFTEKDITPQIRITGGTMAWQGYPELLASFGWDIGIAPLIDEPFNRSKSHIKWMEYSMVNAPTIASPVYPYMQEIQGVKTIEDGITGLFAKDSNEWFKKLEGLILNKKLRKLIAKNAYKYIKENWQYKQHADKWRKVIDKYL